MNAAGTQLMERTAEGGQRVVTTPIADFVEGQMLALYKFLNSDLPDAIRLHAARVGLRQSTMRLSPKMTCLGIERFKTRNGIGA